MDEFYCFLAETYGYEEPIFSAELTNSEFSASRSSVYRWLKTLSEEGRVVRAFPGVYFLPNPKRVRFLGSSPVLSFEKILIKKYLADEWSVFGYRSGFNFANSLGLTSQTASVPTLVTNRTRSVQRVVQFGNHRIFVKKPKLPITAENRKLLQVLDLLSEFDRFSEIPLETADPKIRLYLQGTLLPIDTVESVVSSYDQLTQERFAQLKLPELISATI